MAGEINNSSPVSALTFEEHQPDCSLPALCLSEIFIKPYASPNAWQKGNFFLKSNRTAILIFYIGLIWPLGFFCVPYFLAHTKTSNTATPATPSWEAVNNYRNAFSEEHFEETAVVILEQKSRYNESMFLDDNSNTSLYYTTRSFIFEFEDHLKSLLNIEDYGLSSVSVQSFYDFEELGLLQIGNKSVSDDMHTQLVLVTYHSDQCVAFLEELVRYCRVAVPDPLDISYSGFDVFSLDILASIKNDLGAMDRISLPLAIIIVGLVLKNFPVVIVTLLSTGTTIIVWSIVMSVLAFFNIFVSDVTPAFMMSLTLAIGIDHSLFMLSRILAEMPEKGEEDAIAIAFQYSGHSIVSSGLTFALCMLGLLLAPMELVQRLGLGGAIAILSCMIVNLSLIPCVLYTACGKRILNMRIWKASNFIWWKAKGERFDLDDKKEDLIAPLLSGTISKTDYNISKEGLNVQKETQGFWHTLAVKLVQTPTNVYILIFILSVFIVPLGYFATKLKIAVSFDFLVPANSPSMLAYQKVGESFGRGVAAPYKLVFDGTDGGYRIDSVEGFRVMHAVLIALTGIHGSENQVPLSSYAGISALDGIIVSHNQYRAALTCDKMNCKNEKLRSLAYVDKRFTSSTKFATYLSVTLPIDPTSTEGTTWLKNCREIIHSLKKDPDFPLISNYKVYFIGASAALYDSSQSSFDALPIMMLTTSFTVLIFVGLFFRSAVIPLRSLFSIACTLATSAGLTVLVYQYGILNWTGVRALSSADQHPEVFFLVPLLAVCTIFGLGLDYDIFLLTRVLEYRMDGYTENSSIVMGLTETGTIISAAGIIMAAAFGGLLASQSFFFNQFAFVLIVAVMVDTFVVRTIIVPIVLSLTTKFSWWPREMPSATKNILS